MILIWNFFLYVQIVPSAIFTFAYSDKIKLRVPIVLEVPFQFQKYKNNKNLLLLLRTIFSKGVSVWCTDGALGWRFEMEIRDGDFGWRFEMEI